MNMAFYAQTATLLIQTVEWEWERGHTQCGLEGGTFIEKKITGGQRGGGGGTY